MRPINVRTLMIAAVSAAVLAGTVVPANAAELTDPGAPAEVAAATGARKNDLYKAALAAR